MNHSKESGPEQETSKLQKTVSNLISNVISSLCQQFIRYEHSVDIFGLLSINIDDDVDISVKLNEKFIKKDLINNSTGFDCSKLIETIKKNGDEKNIATEQKENDAKKIVSEEKEKENILIIEENEKDLSGQKRRPRKPQQTFRYVLQDEFSDKIRPETISALSDDESKVLKIDTQYICGSIIEQKKPNQIEIIDLESVTKSNKTNECEDKSKRIRLELPNSNIKVFINEKESNQNKTNILFKCTICDRQFKRKFCLTRHKRVHQNFKSYNCNICGLGFDLINQLKRHMRNMHLYNRDNIRNSFRNNQQITNDLNHTSEIMGALDYSWSNLNNIAANSTCASSITSKESQQVQSNASALAQFSYPSLVLASQSGKKPISNTFANSFANHSSIPNHYQIRQLFNSINPGSEASFPFTNQMYFLQNYPPILPATSQNLYSTAMSNSKIPTTTHISGISSSSLPRLPIYRFNPNMLNSPSLKNMSLVNRTWSNSVSISESTSSEKFTIPKA